MSRSFQGSANAYLAHAAAIAALQQTQPFTVSVWSYCHDNNVRPLFARYSPGFIFQWAGGQNMNFYNGGWVGGGGGLQPNSYIHMAAVFAGGSSEIKLNNISYAVGDTGGGTTSGAFRIGGRSDGYQFYGYMAEAALWDVALTPQELRALSRHVSPAVIRPTALKGYWPLWGNGIPEIDCSRTRVPIPSAGGAVPTKHSVHFAGSPMAL